MKQYSVETFMSWENEDHDGTFIRAIALCNAEGYFEQAINCVRDSDMGEKDEKGVYSRIWWADYIKCYGNERDIRPATPQEVELYLQYCDIGSEYSEPYYKAVKRIYDDRGTHIVFERRGWFARNIFTVMQAIRQKVTLLWYKLKYRTW